MILLYAKAGEITEDQLDFLIDNLEEEWSDDRDYFLNREMVNALAQKGADAALLALLQNAMGDKDEVDILWVDTEELEEDDEEF
ncbi:MAG TPA: galactosyldiacylglycerol synthase [Dehalococcoidia bacterium]|nr:galactosyldiacylglycerol synthase [Dehalococcoidia bacterium]